MWDSVNFCEKSIYFVILYVEISNLVNGLFV